MLIFGLFAMVASGAAGGYLCWENRHTSVQVQIGNYTWTGHLFGVFIIGALLACWFLLGASCLRLRIRERRGAAAAKRRRRESPRQPSLVEPRH